MHDAEPQAVVLNLLLMISLSYNVIQLREISLLTYRGKSQVEGLVSVV